MNETTIALLVTLGVFALAGIGILRIGMKGRRAWRRRLERERARATGVILEVKREARKGGYRTPGYTAYTPLVEFRAEGQTHRLEATGSTQADEFAPGDSAEVLYDPDDPAHFHVEGRDCDEKGDGRLIRFGLIWLGCIAIAAVAILAARRI